MMRVKVTQGVFANVLFSRQVVDFDSQFYLTEQPEAGGYLIRVYIAESNNTAVFYTQSTSYFGQVEVKVYYK